MINRETEANLSFRLKFSLLWAYHDSLNLDGTFAFFVWKEDDRDEIEHRQFVLYPNYRLILKDKRQEC